MSFGLPGPMQTTFELTDCAAYVKFYARCGYTNTTCTQFAKKSQKHKKLTRTFPPKPFLNNLKNLGGLDNKSLRGADSNTILMR